MNPYIQSLRLRTLPLSVSGIILGSGLAYTANNELFSANGSPAWGVFVLAILTTLCLQILSNLCNELGDAQKGTDADQHGRQAYGLQAGTITMLQMKRMIILFVMLSILFGSALVFVAFWATPYTVHCTPYTNTLIFLLLGWQSWELSSTHSANIVMGIWDWETWAFSFSSACSARSAPIICKCRT